MRHLAALVGEEQVGGLHVAVDQALRVGRVERPGHLGQQGDDVPGLERAGGQPRLEVGSLDVAHGDVVRAVDLAGLVDRDDVGVVDRRCQLRLTQEAGPERLVIGEVRRQQLQGHPPPQAALIRQVDDAHPAAADDRLDPIGAELGAEAGVGAAGHGAMNRACLSNHE